MQNTVHKNSLLYLGTYCMISMLSVVMTKIINIPLSTLNIHTPGLPTLLVWVTLMMLGVSDPGTVIWLIPSPTLIPARASVPPSPLIPSEASPVVHCISV